MNASAADQFNAVAAAYAASGVHARGQDLAWLVEALGAATHWSVLDVGTGAGHASLAVAPHVAAVTAIDVAEQMLHVASGLALERGYANISFRKAAAEALPFADSTFDGAFSRFSAHHWPDLAVCMREITRVLKPGAPFVLVDTMGFENAALDTFINTLELLRDPSHVRNTAPGALHGMMEACGLHVGAARTWDLDLETTIWLDRARTAAWRRDACWNLLRESPGEAREALHIRADGAAFTLPCALVQAVKPARS